MDLPDLRERDQSVDAPVARIDDVGVDPVRGVGVAADFQVLLERLGADGVALIEEGLDLAQHEGVAFECGRVVGLQVPDVGPDQLGLGGRWEATETFVELGDGCA